MHHKGLKVAVRSFRDNVHVHRAQICALQPSRETAEDHIDHVMLVKHIAEAAELFLVG